MVGWHRFWVRNFSIDESRHHLQCAILRLRAAGAGRKCGGKGMEHVSHLCAEMGDLMWSVGTEIISTKRRYYDR